MHKLWILLSNFKNKKNNYTQKEKKMIDWTDAASQVSTHFTVRECLWLPTWSRLANESDGLNEDIQTQLAALCAKMDQIRDLLGSPMNVHCMYRPPAYNLVIGAPENDVHSLGQAIDFDCNPSISCDQVRANLCTQLDNFDIRMERGTTTWIHLDIHPVGVQRYFYP